MYLKAVSITRTRVLQLDVSAVLKTRLPGCRLVRVARYAKDETGGLSKLGFVSNKRAAASRALGRWLASVRGPCLGHKVARALKRRWPKRGVTRRY